MKTIVRILAICAVGALLVVSCGKKDKLSVVGCWQLESLETRAAVGDVEVDVYVSFTPDKSFELYQMIGEGRYRRFTGTYTLTGTVLDGSYSDGSKWGSAYDVSVSKGTLTLTTRPSDSSSGIEVSTYLQIPVIPDSVLSSVN